jgi:hypothetical protein
MNDTMKTMELVYADLLTPGQLMEGDLIKIDDSLVEVISIVDDATGDNYTITYLNEYDEQDEKFCNHEDMFKLYVYVEED